jgi:SAM-dependent methyltransferase
VLSDLSPGMVQHALHNLGSSPHRFRYCVLDAQTIPLPGESVDGVIANHVLYHVPNRGGTLREVYRVLRPGGHLYAATNGLEHMRELRDWVARFEADTETMNVAAEFGLENGAAQLSHYFADIRCCRQENALVVTEAQPLIAYGLSIMLHTALSRDAERFSRSVREEIASHGAFHIQKDSGMFKATKA